MEPNESDAVRAYREKLESLTPERKELVDQDLDYLQGYLRLILAQYEEIEAKLPPPTPAHNFMVSILQKPEFKMVAQVIQVKSMVLGVSEMIGILEKMRRDLK